MRKAFSVEVLSTAYSAEHTPDMFNALFLILSTAYSAEHYSQVNNSRYLSDGYTQLSLLT